MVEVNEALRTFFLTFILTCYYSDTASSAHNPPTTVVDFRIDTQKN